MAKIYKDAGNYKKSKKIHLQTISFIKNMLGDNSSLIISSMNELAVLYEIMGDSWNAEKTFKKAIEIYNIQSIKDYDIHASLLSGLALNYQNSG